MEFLNPDLKKMSQREAIVFFFKKKGNQRTPMQ